MVVDIDATTYSVCVGRITDLVFGKRDAAPAPARMVGFPSDGGLLSAGVTGTTALGLSSVWRCLDILSNGVSQLKWREVRGNLDLPPSRLVSNPLADATRREWVSFVVATLALYDVQYLLKVGGNDSEGVPSGLLPLDPGMCQPKTYSSTYSSFLRPDAYDVLGVQVPSDRIVVIRRSPLPGIFDGSGGVIKLARTMLAAAISAEGYASRYWQGGGSPNIVLEADAQIPDAIALQLSDRWRERRTHGPDYAPVLSGGLKARDFGADPTAASAVEARREMVADIGRFFGVPTRILNAPTGDSETYTSGESANMDLVRFTLQNYIGSIEDCISDLLPGGRRMVMDTRPLVRGTMLATAQASQLATGGKAWMSVDEVREEMGLAPQEAPGDLNPPAPEPVMAAMPGDTLD